MSIVKDFEAAFNRQDVEALVRKKILDIGYDSSAKGFDGAAPVSLVVPKEHAGDPENLALTLAVNGETRQSGSTAQMLHDVRELVALASRLITLERGDLLFTGTPSGVGPVVPGDVLTARLGEIAELTVTAR